RRRPPRPPLFPYTTLFRSCPNSHSAVKVPGRQLIVTTDEVYGKFTSPAFGCPWGWMRLISVADESHPTIVGWLSSATLMSRIQRSEEHTSELQSLAYLVCR